MLISQFCCQQIDLSLPFSYQSKNRVYLLLLLSDSVGQAMIKRVILQQLIRWDLCRFVSEQAKDPLIAQGDALFKSGLNCGPQLRRPALRILLDSQPACFLLGNAGRYLWLSAGGHETVDGVKGLPDPHWRRPGSHLITPVGAEVQGGRFR